MRMSDDVIKNNIMDNDVMDIDQLTEYLELSRETIEGLLKC